MQPRQRRIHPSCGLRHQPLTDDLKGPSMLKLLKYSVLALVLALGSSTFAHAETTTTVDGGLLGEILSWLFPPPPSNNHHGNTAPEIDPSLATSGLLLLGGTLVVTRRRRVDAR